jgi:hypothetical protein
MRTLGTKEYDDGIQKTDERKRSYITDEASLIVLLAK